MVLDIGAFDARLGTTSQTVLLTHALVLSEDISALRWQVIYFFYVLQHSVPSIVEECTKWTSHILSEPVTQAVIVEHMLHVKSILCDVDESIQVRLTV